MRTSMQHRTRAKREAARRHALAHGDAYTVGLIDYRLSPYATCPYAAGSNQAIWWQQGRDDAQGEDRLASVARTLDAEQG